MERRSMIKEGIFVGAVVGSSGFDKSCDLSFAEL